MVTQRIHCRYCQRVDVVRYGYQSGHARFRCKTCQRIFKTHYDYTAREPGVKGICE